MITTEVVDPPTPHPAQKVRVAIADPQPIFRHGLRRLLETDPRLVIMSETDDGGRAVAAICELRPDVLPLGLNALGCRAVAEYDLLATELRMSSAVNF
jgi:DNA-binding NarL/FixJ family response regulator